MIVTYNIQLPTGLTEKQRELLREMQKAGAQIFQRYFRKVEFVKHYDVQTSPYLLSFFLALFESE